MKERKEIRNRRYGPSGYELAQRRKMAGLTQSQLARRAGISRHTVSYWEVLPGIDPNSGAVGLMAGVLGWDLEPYRYRIRVLADGEAPRGIPLFRDNAAELQDMLDASRARIAAHAARRRVTCGAKTRKGTPCRNKSEPGNRRCKFHGGKSTGARTAEGRERLREANRRRWARWREDRASEQAAPPA